MTYTSMFANRQQQQVAQQPQLEFYDLNQIAGQFAGWNFGLGSPYDENTPQIALLTIREIQAQAQRGHPIRVGMFGIISENGFNNGMFNDLVCVIVSRTAMGVANDEWRNLEVAVNTTIQRAVKCCASAMAASDAEFMNTLAGAEAAAVRENADVWEYLLRLTQGSDRYIPFNQMASGGQGTGISSVGGATQEALREAQQLRGQSGGQFVDSATYGSVTPGQHNNDAGAVRGRYARKAEKLYGKLEGSMQTALGESGLSTGAPAATSTYKARFSRGAMGNKAVGNELDLPAVDPQAAAAAQKFDTDVTDFSKSMADTTVNAPAPVVEAKPIFSVQMNGEVVNVMRECVNGAALWKSSRLQRFHPAWCKRTHHIRYFETQDGTIIAVMQALTSEQKEIAMNYDAHAIDPSKGQPEPDVPKNPVREEAQVLYKKADEVKVNVVIASAIAVEESVEAAVRSTRVSAEMSKDVPDAFVRTSIINSAVIYRTAEEANSDSAVIAAIGSSKDFAEAASYIGKIKNDLARANINEVLTQAVNRATECELGLGIRISDFGLDGAEIIAAVESNFGALPARQLEANQQAILKANIGIEHGTTDSGRAHAEATLDTSDEGLSDEQLARILFLQRNITTAWVDFTDSEMAIGVPAKGAAAIQAESLGGLWQIAKTVFRDAIGSMASSEQYIVTSDNVRYRLHRGMLNADCYLISKEVK